MLKDAKSQALSLCLAKTRYTSVEITFTCFTKQIFPTGCTVDHFANIWLIIWAIFDKLERSKNASKID